MSHDKKIQEFPKWKYRKADNKKGFEARIIHSKKGEDALGKNWVNSPKELGLETHPQDPNATPIDAGSGDEAV